MFIATNGGGLEVLFWIVVAVIWFVSQILRAARRQGKGERTAPVPPPEPASPAERDAEGREWEQQLSEFLESLGGGDPPRNVPPPPPPRAPEKKPAVAPVQAATPKPASRTVPRRAEPVQRRFPRPPPAPAAPVAPPRPATAFPAAREVDAATATQRPLSRIGTREVLLPTDGLLGMKSYSLAMPRVDSSPSALAGIGWSENRLAFRQAMISHIVLGKPRALDPQAGMPF